MQDAERYSNSEETFRSTALRGVKLLATARTARNTASAAALPGAERGVITVGTSRTAFNINEGARHPSPAIARRSSSRSDSAFPLRRPPPPAGAMAIQGGRFDGDQLLYAMVKHSHAEGR